MIEFLNNIDIQVFLALNGMHNSAFDFIMYWISHKFIWIPLYGLILYLIIKHYKWNSIYILLAIALLIGLSDQISTKLFKNIFERLRPCHNPDLEGLVHIVRNKCGGQYGFISSHAANSFALASFLSLILRKYYKKIGLWFYIWAALIAYSRVYLGVHYPGDVLVGALAGMVLGYLVYKVLHLLPCKIEELYCDR